MRYQGLPSDSTENKSSLPVFRANALFKPLGHDAGVQFQKYFQKPFYLHQLLQLIVAEVFCSYSSNALIKLYDGFEEGILFLQKNNLWCPFKRLVYCTSFSRDWRAGAARIYTETFLFSI